jgi:hypothetical protein
VEWAETDIQTATEKTVAELHLARGQDLFRNGRHDAAGKEYNAAMQRRPANDVDFDNRLSAIMAAAQSVKQAVDKENDARRKALHGELCMDMPWNSEMDPLGYIGQRVQLCWSIAVAGKNQTLRHLAKTHGCNLEELVSLNMHYW